MFGINSFVRRYAPIRWEIRNINIVRYFAFQTNLFQKGIGITRPEIKIYKEENGRKSLRMKDMKMPRRESFGAKSI